MRKIISIKFMNHNPVVTAQICFNFISIYFISVFKIASLSFIVYNQMFHPFSEVHEEITITNFLLPILKISYQSVRVIETHTSSFIHFSLM